MSSLLLSFFILSLVWFLSYCLLPFICFFRMFLSSFPWLNCCHLLFFISFGFFYIASLLLSFFVLSLVWFLSYCLLPFIFFFLYNYILLSVALLLSFPFVSIVYFLLYCLTLVDPVAFTAVISRFFSLVRF